MKDWKAPKLTKQMNIGIFVALAASFVLYYQVSYAPDRATLSNLSQSIASEQLALQRNKTLYAQLSSRKPAMVDLAGSPDDLEKYDQFNGSLANVVDALSKGDGKSPFAVNKIAAVKQEQMDGYTKTVFNLDVDASFLAIGGFLEGLEHSLLLAEVQSVDISRIGSELKRCTAKITLQSYVVKR